MQQYEDEMYNYLIQLDNIRVLVTGSSQRLLYHVRPISLTAANYLGELRNYMPEPPPMICNNKK